MLDTSILLTQVQFLYYVSQLAWDLMWSIREIYESNKLIRMDDIMIDNIPNKRQIVQP
jgi:hypothetical protein